MGILCLLGDPPTSLILYFVVCRIVQCKARNPQAPFLKAIFLFLRIRARVSENKVTAAQQLLPSCARQNDRGSVQSSKLLIRSPVQVQSWPKQRPRPYLRLTYFSHLSEAAFYLASFCLGAVLHPRHS